MPRRRPRPGPHGSSLNDDAVQNTHHPAWRATRQPRQSLLIAQRRADFKRLGAGLPAALCRQRKARKRAGQDEKPSFGETVKKAAGGAQVQAERGEGTGPRSDAVWPVMPRQEGMDGRYPLAGSPQAGRGRNMQHHGREERCCALPWRDGAALASSAPDKERGFLHSSPQNKDVPQPCRGRPCKFWCERRDLNPYG